LNVLNNVQESSEVVQESAAQSVSMDAGHEDGLNVNTVKHKNKSKRSVVQEDNNAVVTNSSTHTTTTLSTSATALSRNDLQPTTSAKSQGIDIVAGDLSALEVKSTTPTPKTKKKKKKKKKKKGAKATKSNKNDTNSSASLSTPSEHPPSNDVSPSERGTSGVSAVSWLDDVPERESLSQTPSPQPTSAGTKPITKKKKKKKKKSKGKTKTKGGTTSKPRQTKTPALEPQLARGSSRSAMMRASFASLPKVLSKAVMKKPSGRTRRVTSDVDSPSAPRLSSNNPSFGGIKEAANDSS
jgi:hypothetical protein